MRSGPGGPGVRVWVRQGPGPPKNARTWTGLDLGQSMHSAWRQNTDSANQPVLQTLMCHHSKHIGMMQNKAGPQAWNHAFTCHQHPNLVNHLGWRQSAGTLGFDCFKAPPKIIFKVTGSSFCKAGVAPRLFIIAAHKGPASGLLAALSSCWTRKNYLYIVNDQSSSTRGLIIVRLQEEQLVRSLAKKR